MGIHFWSEPESISGGCSSQRKRCYVVPLGSVRVRAATDPRATGTLGSCADLPALPPFPEKTNIKALRALNALKPTRSSCKPRLFRWECVKGVAETESPQRYLALLKRFPNIHLQNILKQTIRILRIPTTPTTMEASPTEGGPGTLSIRWLEGLEVAVDGLRRFRLHSPAAAFAVFQRAPTQETHFLLNLKASSASPRSNQRQQQEILRLRS